MPFNVRPIILTAVQRYQTGLENFIILVEQRFHQWMEGIISIILEETKKFASTEERESVQKLQLGNSAVKFPMQMD